MTDPAETRQSPGRTLETFKGFTKCLAYDLTLSESPTHTPLKPHTSHIWAFPLNFPRSSTVYPSHGQKTISCVFPAPGSNGHMNEAAVAKQAIIGRECCEQVIVEEEDAAFCGKKKEKERESWQFPHVEAFSSAARLQKANHGIQQYSETVKSCSVRIPLMINIPGETLRYSLFRAF